MVELLVVIGIIAILIALLLPALGAARRQARSAQCLSNLRMLNVSFLLYTNENKQKSMYWSGTLPPNPSFPDAYVDWVALLMPYYKRDSIRLCPEATTYLPDTGPGTVTTNFGAVSLAWSNRMAAAQTFWAYGSYGFNGWLFRNEPNTVAVLAGFGLLNGETGLYNLPAKSSSDVPLFADCIWFGGWPQTTDTPCPNNLTGDMNNSKEMRRFQLARHKKAINIGYLDGHAAPVLLQDLWNQHWRADWVPPATIPKIPN